MCNEDLPAAHDLCKGNARVLLPVLDCLHALDEDDEVVAGALEVDLGLSLVSAGHFGICG